jgi:hypothetical protein
MALLPRGYIDGVVAIGQRSETGDCRWVATGFIFFVEAVLAQPNPLGQKAYWTYLVTNRHVLEGKDTVVLRFNPSSPGSPEDFDVALLDEHGPLWTKHPDSDVDVAAVNVNAIYLASRNLTLGAIERTHCAWTLEEMQQQGVVEGDGIFLIGFPMGLMSPQMQYAIARVGCVARIRDAYDAKKGAFLIDASNFPGNSGGPVFIRPDAGALLGTKLIGRCMLIGVVHSYLPYLDVARSEQTGRPRIIFEENSGLALVDPVDRIMEVCALERSRADKRPPTPPASNAPDVETPEHPTPPGEEPASGEDGRAVSDGEKTL